MFKKQLANNETYFKGTDDSLQVDTSLTVYEVFIELGRDKEGNVLKNRDGSDRYFPINDENIVTLDKEIKVKKIRDGLFKPLFEVNGDLVEKVDRDDKRIYYVVEAEKITTLPVGTKVTMSKSGYYKSVELVGYALVDDTVEGKERTLTVKPFSTEDHVKEAEDIVHSSKYRHHHDED